MMSCGPMLMILQPIEEAELRARVWFSWIVKVFSLPLLMARSSTVPDTEALISLLNRGRKGGTNMCVSTLYRYMYKHVGMQMW